MWASVWFSNLLVLVFATDAAEEPKARLKIFNSLDADVVEILI